MSTDGSSQPPPTLEESSGDNLSGARFLDSHSTTLATTTACANCGRRFAGNYCPTCGQKADAELSITDIIGGFFRDLLDAERGLWPTLKGLTIAPGRTLRHYLSGARRQYVNPGRYLLFAILFRGGTYQLMKWTEVAEENTKPDAAVDAIQAAFQTIIPTSTGGYAYIAWICLFGGLLGLLYHHLFASKTRNRATAVAIAVFIAAHGLILSTLLEAGWQFPRYATIGEPMTGSGKVFVGTLLGYAGLATYRCFQSHWIDGPKAVLAVFWACVEMYSVGAFITLGYAGVLSLADPETYPLVATEGGEMGLGAYIAIIVFLTVLGSLPLLLHAGVAAYTRSR